MTPNAMEQPEPVGLTEMERVRQLADRRQIEIYALVDALKFYASASQHDFSKDNGGEARAVLLSLGWG